MRVDGGTPAVCPHLHVPLQAADDGVLRPHAPALRHHPGGGAPRHDPRAAARRVHRHRPDRGVPRRGRRRVRAHAGASSRRVRSPTATSSRTRSGRAPPRPSSTAATRVPTIAGRARQLRDVVRPQAGRVRAALRRRPSPRCWSRRRAIRAAASCAAIRATTCARVSTARMPGWAAWCPVAAARRRKGAVGAEALA